MSANVVGELLKRRVIMVLGKGGVGRTAVSAALAKVAAGRGMRTLVMETDPRTPIAAEYGRKGGFAPCQLELNLWSMYLGGRESLEDYLSIVVPRPLLRAIFASSLYQYFVEAAPAVRELTMMGKIYHEIVRRPKREVPWDIIVVDTPASGQALSMLRMPFAARAAFADSTVGREAREVASFFRDRALCSMVIVTTAEALPLAETLEIEGELRKLELAAAAVLLNRVSTAAFNGADIGALLRRGVKEAALHHIGDLAEVARDGLKRAGRDRRAFPLLRRQISAPIIELGERRGLCGRALAAELAAQLGAGGFVRTGEAAAG